MIQSEIQKSVQALEAGGVIAYPTEAVFGLGCDPDNQDAVSSLLNIKQRPIEKGLILIAAEIAQLTDYVDFDLVPQHILEQVKASWPGPFTWIMPAKKSIGFWITGKFDTVAVRVSKHPSVSQLCMAYGKPITSTSANLTGLAPCLNEAQVNAQLGEKLGYILPGEIGGLDNPTQIRDALTGKIIRQG